MSKIQKTVLAILGIVAAVFFGAAAAYAWTNYRAFATKPLGPALPVVTQSLPPVWTATPGAIASSSGEVTLAPTLSLPTETQPAPLCGGPAMMTVLAIGQDQRSNNYQYGLGDIVRVVRIDFVTPKVTVLEFPRDLWVEIPYIADNLNGFNHGKLNQAYLYGQPGDGFAYWDDPSQGPGLLALTLNLNFGVQIDHYLAVNMRTFENVVNAIDGITINVPDIDTAHKTGLPIGKHHLNGAEALKVARNREEGMFERVSNQNLVLCAMREKVLSPSTVTKIPELIQSFQDNIQTDFTPEQLSQLACLGTKLPVENIAFASFPEELFTEVRIYDDPAYPKGLLIFDADFNILRDYVTRFHAGTWPQTEGSTAPTTEEEASSSSFCP
jgi:LCP family protein required for cell wall assembly